MTAARWISSKVRLPDDSIHLIRKNGTASFAKNMSKSTEDFEWLDDDHIRKEESFGSWLNFLMCSYKSHKKEN